MTSLVALFSLLPPRYSVEIGQYDGKFSARVLEHAPWTGWGKMEDIDPTLPDHELAEPVPLERRYDRVVRLQILVTTQNDFDIALHKALVTFIANPSTVDVCSILDIAI
jgi:hypothetical protein